MNNDVWNSNNDELVIRYEHYICLMEFQRSYERFYDSVSLIYVLIYDLVLRDVTLISIQSKFIEKNYMKHFIFHILY